MKGLDVRGFPRHRCDPLNGKIARETDLNGPKAEGQLLEAVAVKLTFNCMQRHGNPFWKMSSSAPVALVWPICC